MAGHQWLKKRINYNTYVVVGTVDYADKVKRKFYVDAMVAKIKKDGHMAKTRVVPPTQHYHGYVEILAKQKPLLYFSGIAWVHPRGGGDDYQVRVKTRAENLTEAKKQIREHLIKKLHTAPLMADDFTLKQVKR